MRHGGSIGNEAGTMIAKAPRRLLKALLPRRVIDQLVLAELGMHAFRDVRGRHPRECPICGYHGLFWGKGRQPMVFDGLCPRCHSVGRHRQQQLLIDRHPEYLDGQSVLHFAPEPCFDRRYRERLQASGGDYVRADYLPHKGEIKVDLQAMPFPDGAFDTVICNNVLEHVPDDHKAMTEIARVLRPGGRALLTVPLYDAWEKTYEDPTITDPVDRDLHFNKDDHLRLYGRDFRDKLGAAGLAFTTFVATEPDVSRYALERGETIFIATPLAKLDHA
jgi:SAM-dependent methyltransferase